MLTLPPSGTGMGVIDQMLKVVERHNVTLLMAAPPLVVAMTKIDEKALRFNLEPLHMVMSGGAPLSTVAAKQFRKMYPRILLAQVINTYMQL